jgi:hypothetical protein
MPCLGTASYVILVLGGIKMMDYLKNRLENFLDYIADALIDFDLEFDDEPFEKEDL